MTWIFGMRSDVSTFQPQLVAIRLIFLDKSVHIDLYCINTTSASQRTLTVFHPAGQSEVRGFGTVETVIEARMVGEREGDHEFAGLLGDSVERYRVILQNLRGDQMRLVP